MGREGSVVHNFCAQMWKTSQFIENLQAIVKEY